MNTVITDSIPAHIEGGRIVPDAPIAWADGTHLVLGTPVEASAEGDCSADGRPWPKTPEERAAWIREMDETPPLFATDQEHEKFVAFLQETKERNKAMLPEYWKKIDELFS